jgi:hypothetical protein
MRWCWIDLDDQKVTSPFRRCRHTLSLPCAANACAKLRVEPKTQAGRDRLSARVGLVSPPKNCCASSIHSLHGQDSTCDDSRRPVSRIPACSGCSGGPPRLCRQLAPDRTLARVTKYRAGLANTEGWYATKLQAPRADPEDGQCQAVGQSASVSGAPPRACPARIDTRATARVARRADSIRRVLT